MYSQYFGPGSALRCFLTAAARFAFEDSELSNSLYEKLKTVEGALSLIQDHTPGLVLAGRFSSQMRFYRYHQGQMFKPHFDGIMVDPASATESRWTLLMQLNEEYQGGHTIFHISGKDQVSVQPRTGQAVCFFHRTKHEGAEVISGAKYVLRADIMFHQNG